MRIFSCENPQTIRNPYTKEVLRVRCGKCKSCQNIHAKYWIDKLEQERRCWRYCYMATLTFDDKHLPKLFDDGRGNLVDYDHADVCIPFSDLDIKTDADLKYLNSRLTHRLGLPYHRTDIVQKFHKRLNKLIHDKFTKKYQNFRYLLVEEYGGDTLRPHLHGLYFFNSREVASNFREILFEAWQNSDNVLQAVKTDSVRGSAASYVAQYINCFSTLPSFYSHGAIKPKYFYSKCPPLGSLASREDFEALFLRETPTTIIKGVKSNKFVSVPLSSSVRNRLYPKIPRYSELSLYGRVKAYGLCRELSSWSFDSFKAFLKEHYEPKINNILYKRPFQSESYKEFNSYLLWLTNGFRLSPSQYLDPSDYESVNNRLKRFYYVSCRVCSQADVFGIGIYDYVRHIDNFYNNVSSFNLSKFYERQKAYTCALHDVEDLGLMYDCPDDFYHAYKFEYVPNFTDTFGYRDISSMADKIYRDSTKTHKKNDYLDRCRDKKLSLIMKSYFDLWQKM